MNQDATVLVEEGRMILPYVSMWMDEGILYARYADQLHISLEVAKACVEARLFFSKGKTYPVLVDMRGVKIGDFGRVQCQF